MGVGRYGRKTPKIPSFNGLRNQRRIVHLLCKNIHYPNYKTKCINVKGLIFNPCIWGCLTSYNVNLRVLTVIMNLATTYEPYLY